jgi:hypothetical protein
MSYQIDPNKPSEKFLDARNIAGVSLQNQFKAEGGKIAEPLDYRWIKADLTWPSFDNLTFAYGNQVFSVLVNITDEKGSSLTQMEISRCVEACKANDLVPCVFDIDSKSLRPKMLGWNLRHLCTGESLIPSNIITRGKILMSEWELRNFSIQIVRNHLSEDNGKSILSYCDVLGIDPQIWFENGSGERNWIIVRHYPVIKGDEKNEWVGFERSNPQLQEYDGYLAVVSMASSEPVLYDLDGNLIPLSERFNGKAPLYRGDGFYIKFDGLQRIFVS